MNTGANLKRVTLAATLLGSLSLPLMAQQPAAPASSQPPATTPSTPAATPAATTAAAPAAPIADLRPVAVELEQKLDTKTAKNGDSVVAQTKSNIKTSDGTEIPKGSKLIGHILAVQPSSSTSQNSQIALKFDQIQIKGGQSLNIQSQIESITPAGMDTSAQPAAADASPSPAGTPQAPASGPAPHSGTNVQASAAPGSPASPAASNNAAGGPPAPGTVVAQNGGINITMTSVPGILLANNAPGQQDPRLAKVSSILLGARRDIQLDSGTKMTIGVAAAGQ